MSTAAATNGGSGFEAAGNAVGQSGSAVPAAAGACIPECIG